MSFVRPGSKKLFSNSENQGLYVFLSAGGIQDYGALKNPEDFCEVMFRILDQSGAEVTLETVNKVRDTLYLEPLDELGDEYGKTEEFLESIKE